MHRVRQYAVGLLVASVAACGGAQPESRVEEAAKEAAKSAETAAKGLEQMAKSLQELGNSSHKAVEPVSFRELQMLFPDLDGWEKGKPTGEKMSAPFSFSQAQVSYQKGDSKIDAKIVDSGFNQILFAPFTIFLTSGYEKETEDGYEKSVNVGGNPGWEKWSTGRKNGELNAVVAKRFLVSLEGDEIENTTVLHSLAQKTDMAKLASLK